MSTPDLKAAYRTILSDHFSPRMEISFIDGEQRQTLCYEKVEWTIDGESKGLRYGENPGQEAALYKLVNGNLALGEVTFLQPGRYLASDVELLQSGKDLIDSRTARHLQQLTKTLLVCHLVPPLADGPEVRPYQ